MKKLALGCGGILLLVIGASIASTVLGLRQIKSASKTMFQQFTVGSPVIPFSPAQAGRILMSFEHHDDALHRPCLIIVTRKDRVMFSYDGTDETVGADSFQQKLASFRERVVRCDELSVHVFSSVPISARATFHVRYDHAGIVSELDAPYTWD